MARILAISSRVAHGHVGLSIIVPALQALGHDVIELPTIILSNHPGHPQVAGTPIEPAILTAMLDALEANGWLVGLDAVLTGYLPSPAHVAFAANAVQKVRSLNNPRHVAYLCDPVLGDDPKGLYIDPAAANSIRDCLISLADIATPNRFELSYLNAKVAGVETQVDVQSAEQAAKHALIGPITFATSIPSILAGETLNVVSYQSTARLTRVPLRSNAPHGTGDLFSALVLSAWLEAAQQGKANQNVQTSEILSAATAGVDAVLAASQGLTELLINALPRRGQRSLSWPVEVLAARPLEPDVFGPRTAAIEQ
jgi:pyridoxine kinase